MEQAGEGMSEKKNALELQMGICELEVVKSILATTFGKNRNLRSNDENSVIKDVDKLARHLIKDYDQAKKELKADVISPEEEADFEYKVGIYIALIKRSNNMQIASKEVDRLIKRMSPSKYDGPLGVLKAELQEMAAEARSEAGAYYMEQIAKGAKQTAGPDSVLSDLIIRSYKKE